MIETTKYYYKEYSNTDQVYFNRTLKTIENLINELPIIDECIGFQVWLDEQIASLINSNEEKFMQLHEEKPVIAKQLVIGFQLYRRNHQYLFSAYKLALAGLCEPAYNIMRTTHESILALWFITTHPNESTNVLEYMKDNNREGTKYNHNHFVQSLYVGEVAKSMRKAYSGLSVKAHSNVFGMKNTEQYSLEQIRDCFWSIKTQSFYNIIANIENLAQNSDLQTVVLARDTVLFVERLKNEIGGTNKTIADYFPNKGDLKKKFYLYRPD